jgi:hypothetical protein
MNSMGPRAIMHSTHRCQEKSTRGGFPVIYVHLHSGRHWELYDRRSVRLLSHINLAVLNLSSVLLGQDNFTFGHFMRNLILLRPIYSAHLLGLSDAVNQLSRLNPHL